eukprot:GHVU01188911.1.p1 GENE.GHVU01188911.1~~GHVU01188911.1.p1  ORF type:complete len:207 (+),score=32.29 GHVU01188911.1:336-956(+)
MVLRGRQASADFTSLPPATATGIGTGTTPTTTATTAAAALAVAGVDAASSTAIRGSAEPDDPPLLRLADYAVEDEETTATSGDVSPLPAIRQLSGDGDHCHHRDNGGKDTCSRDPRYTTSSCRLLVAAVGFLAEEPLWAAPHNSGPGSARLEAAEPQWGGGGGGGLGGVYAAGWAKAGIAKGAIAETLVSSKVGTYTDRQAAAAQW